MTEWRPYSIEQVAWASDLSMNNLKSLLMRHKELIPQEQIGSRGTGSPRRFTRQAILQFAVGKVLMDSGVGATQAMTAAGIFAYCEYPNRRPGKLYAKGQTILGLWPGAVAISRAEDLGSVSLIALGASKSTSAWAVTVLHLNPVVDKVDKFLAALDRKKIPVRTKAQTHIL